MKRKEVNSRRMPVYRDSGFELFTADIAKEAFLRENDNEREPELYIYSRYRNPTVVAAEEEIMKLEGSDWAVLTQTGMSAIDTALSIFQRGEIIRPWLFFSEIYGGTISFAESILRKRRGLDIHSYTPLDGKYDLDYFEDAVSAIKPELVYIETISNPMLIVPDIAGVIRIAKKHSSRVIVDNTFATPYLLKPLDYGADIVIHSATKYLSGHGNITAGVLCGNDKNIMREAVEYRKYVGHMLSADDAYRLTTQLQTFELRFARQCSNAMELAAVLCKTQTISKVWFPGLETHPTHKEAKRLFGNKGYGGMITFDFAGNKPVKRRRRDSFIQAVSEKIRLVPTLGDPVTILLPVESVWGAKYPEPGMIRLSAGFEDTVELLAVIKRALDKIR